jgi:hypothetical protein
VLSLESTRRTSRDEQWATDVVHSGLTVYYESIKGEIKIKPIYECRCDESLKTKVQESTRLTYTGLGINQKNKKKIKVETTKTNIHSLLNILKAYYTNTHQDSPKSTMCEGTDTIQLVIDTRQAL